MRGSGRNRTEIFIHARLGLAILLGASVAGCATSPVAPVVAQAPKPAPVEDHTSGMAEVPSCPDGMVATLDSGVQVRFDGGTPHDPSMCVQTWSQREHEYFLSVWRKERLRPDSSERREAIAQILTAPVGASVRFALKHNSPRTFFDSATLRHVANETLTVGTKARPALKLELVLHDAQKRPDVKAERLLWIDRETGIPLKKEVVTRTADGGVWNTTVWRVRELAADPPIENEG